MFLPRLNNRASATVYVSSLSHELSKVLFVYFIVLGY